MSEVSKSAEDYIKAVRKNVRIGDRCDGRGKPVEDLNDDEMQAIRDFIVKLNEREGKVNGLHCVLNLGQKARKTVVAFFGLLPLLLKTSEESGKALVYLTATAQTESRARNDMRGMMMLTPIECETWDSAALLAEHGKLRDFWIIGDLDWGESLGNTERICKGINMSHKAGASILLHRTGDQAIADPARTGKSGCMSVLVLIPLLYFLLASLF